MSDRETPVRCSVCGSMMVVSGGFLQCGGCARRIPVEAEQTSEGPRWIICGPGPGASAIYDEPRELSPRERLEELREMRRDVMDRLDDAMSTVDALSDELSHLSDEMDELLRDHPDVLWQLGRERVS